MKIRFVQSIAAHADPTYDLPDCSFAPGQVANIHKTLAGHWIASGIAAAVKPVKLADVPEPTEAIDQEGE